MKLFFIHKFIDGKVVKFTTVPQVKHQKQDTMYNVNDYPYIRTLKGRIAKVKRAFKKSVDTAKEPGDTERFEKIWFFDVVFLDNNEQMQLKASIHLCSVKIHWFHLLCYKIYQKICKKK